MVAPSARSLTAWSRSNAVAMALASTAAAWVARPWPLAAAAIPSFGVLVLAHRGHWTPAGRFGAANLVTALRLGILVALATVLHGWRGIPFAATLLVVFALDWVDGWLARRLRLAGEFGAHFDMEVDAFLVLTLGMELWQRGRFGAWILTAGLLRYGYVLCLALVPARGGEEPRSVFGRVAFSCLLVGLAAALADAGSVGTIAAFGGTALVVVSFARSFWFSYGAGGR